MSLRAIEMMGRHAVAVGAMLLVFSASGFSQDAPATPKEKTLYSRMGGYDVLAGITDDWLSQLKGDAAFIRFGGGRSLNSLMRSRQLIVDHMCAITGGPCVYIGRETKPAHQGLAITQAEWDSGIAKLKNSLAKLKVGEQEQKEFLALIESEEKDTVEPPKKESY